MRSHIALFFAVSTTFIWNWTQAQNKSSLTAQEFSRKIEQTRTAHLVDVRTPKEYADGHLINARNYDWRGSNFDHQIEKLDKTKPVLVYCLTGGRSASAARKMRSDGFREVYELEGGYEQWKASRLPTTTD